MSANPEDLKALGVCEKCQRPNQKLFPVDRDDFTLYVDSKLEMQLVSSWRIVRKVCIGCVRGAKQVTDSSPTPDIIEAAPPEEKAELLWALQALTKFCTSGERYKTINPYAVPEIKAALQAIAKARGKDASGCAWMDANND